MQEDLPFVHSVASFPVAKKPASYVSFESKGEVNISPLGPSVCCYICPSVMWQLLFPIDLMRTVSKFQLEIL